MERLIINGGRRLDGRITVQGAKNSVLPILAAAVINGKQNIIHNCPDLSDVDKTIEILEGLGCRVIRRKNDIMVDSSCACACTIPENLMRQLRSSIIFLGAILSRFGQAAVSTPGGCEIGNRPIDLHLKALARLGIAINEEHGFINCIYEKPHGTYIHLDFPSVGATENIMLTACALKGETTITNAAKEPEICDLAEFLTKMGARVIGAGTDTIHIMGAKNYNAVEHTVIPDRIVGATYFAAGAVTGGRIALDGARADHMRSMINTLKEMGCIIENDGELLVLKAPKRLSCVHTLRTMPYPGFPTDIQSPFMTAAAVASGTSVFVENIFENRFKHVEELTRMGADISVDGRVAVVRGVEKLDGASVMASDLRGGASLVLAGLCADGTTQIGNICHIKRGYENIADSLTGLGADIKTSDN